MDKMKKNGKSKGFMDMLSSKDCGDCKGCDSGMGCDNQKEESLEDMQPRLDDPEQEPSLLDMLMETPKAKIDRQVKHNQDVKQQDENIQGENTSKMDMLEKLQKARGNAIKGMKSGDGAAIEIKEIKILPKKKKLSADDESSASAPEMVTGSF